MKEGYNKLALMGVSGSGKDYLAKHLINSYCFKRFSFSDQLKKLANLIYPWLETDYPPIKKEVPLKLVLNTGEEIKTTPRKVWLHLNMLRDIENLIFIRMLGDEIDNYLKQQSFGASNSHFHERVLISDVRSGEEFRWCKDHGFKVVYIEPSKKVYQDYEIDRFIKENAKFADFTFINKFDGLGSFKDFIQHLFT